MRRRPGAFGGPVKGLGFFANRCVVSSLREGNKGMIMRQSGKVRWPLRSGTGLR